MHTSDKSAPTPDTGEPGRSFTSASRPAKPTSDALTPEDIAAITVAADDERCTAIRKKTGTRCANYAVKGGRCRWHIVDEVVPADELEALRQLETAAAQHALDAHHALVGGEAEQDEAFNRNARTAAQIARIRRTLGGAPAKDGEPEQVDMPGNHRDDTAPADKKDEPSS